MNHPSGSDPSLSPENDGEVGYHRSSSVIQKRGKLVGQNRGIVFTVLTQVFPLRRLQTEKHGLKKLDVNEKKLEPESQTGELSVRCSCNSQDGIVNLSQIGLIFYLGPIT